MAKGTFDFLSSHPTTDAIEDEAWKGNRFFDKRLLGL